MFILNALKRDFIAYIVLGAPEKPFMKWISLEKGDSIPK